VLTAGSIFADYLIERQLGAGGMGAVYAARHPRLPRRIALKVLSDGLCDDPAFRARFEREGELIARVDHPNVVAVYDRGAADGRLWIAMQCVDGVDVDKLVRSGPSALPPERAVFILSEAAKGLDSAHRNGLLHRDIKPANILVAQDEGDGDRVLVTDFGIARALDQTALTKAGPAPATLSFASPEQIEGRALDHRSDIYSLGCTLFVMLTGSVPFPRNSQLDAMTAHLADPPPKVSTQRPGLPIAMDAVIARAMAKNPADRFGSCRELAAAARAALAAVPPSVEQLRPSPPPLFSGTPHPAGLPIRRGNSLSTGRRQVAIASGVAATGLVAIITASYLVFGGDDHPEGGAGVAAPTSAVPATNTDPWKAYDFVATALPGLVPATPHGTAYQGVTCKATDKKFVPVSDLEAEVAVARMKCGSKRLADVAFVYYIFCNRDQSPQPLTTTGHDWPDLRSERFQRGTSFGEVRYGTVSDGYGMLAVEFQNSSQNYCALVSAGADGTTGQDVYDNWFRTAPLERKE
jgi:serine/threonine protein kinase